MAGSVVPVTIAARSVSGPRLADIARGLVGMAVAKSTSRSSGIGSPTTTSEKSWQATAPPTGGAAGPREPRRAA